jgi:hypothetical protein
MEDDLKKNKNGRQPQMKNGRQPQKKMKTTSTNTENNLRRKRKNTSKKNDDYLKKIKYLFLIPLKFRGKPSFSSITLKLLAPIFKHTSRVNINYYLKL